MEEYITHNVRKALRERLPQYALDAINSLMRRAEKLEKENEQLKQQLGQGSQEFWPQSQQRQQSFNSPQDHFGFIYYPWFRGNDGQSYRYEDRYAPRAEEDDRRNRNEFDRNRNEFDRTRNEFDRIRNESSRGGSNQGGGNRGGGNRGNRGGGGSTSNRAGGGRGTSNEYEGEEEEIQTMPTALGAPLTPIR